MVTRERAQELYEGAIELVQHDGYFVPDELNRTLQFNRRYNAYGVCKTRRDEWQKLYSAEISVSKYFVDSEGTTDAQVFQTCVHEVLHACFPGEGHKGAWKAAAERISRLHSNLNIKRCSNHVDADGKNVLPDAPKRESHISYVMTCPCCGKQWVFHRANRFTKNGAFCKTCKKTLDLVVKHN